MSAALLTAQQQSVLAERIRQRESSAEEDLVRLFSERVMFLALARTRGREVLGPVQVDARAFWLREPGHGEIRSVSASEPGPDDVVVRASGGMGLDGQHIVGRP